MSTLPRKRACALCVLGEKILMVRLEDPATKKEYFFPPGGKIEAGETPAKAAERETYEETGYRVRADPTTESILVYPFVWGGDTYDCTTYFFQASLMDDCDPDPVKDSEFHRGVAWVPVALLDKEFSYHPQLCEAVKSLLEF